MRASAVLKALQAQPRVLLHLLQRWRRPHDAPQTGPADPGIWHQQPSSAGPNQPASAPRRHSSSVVDWLAAPQSLSGGRLRSPSSADLDLGPSEALHYDLQRPASVSQPLPWPSESPPRHVAASSTLPPCQTFAPLQCLTQLRRHAAWRSASRALHSESRWLASAPRTPSSPGPWNLPSTSTASTAVLPALRRVPPSSPPLCVRCCSADPSAPRARAAWPGWPSAASPSPARARRCALKHCSSPPPKSPTLPPTAVRAPYSWLRQPV
mmetsp:Transcript_73290/g.157011  ORF Transcript_73290/g.157011 Transcript_73290/m.157011 type:complete len:267 (-) Transcript_73290:639-1439(-)